jgi:hypothetical protein
MKRVILGAVLALVATGLTGPARADSTYGSTAGVNGVLYDDCRYHPYRYAASPPGDPGYWDLVVSLRGPDGREAASDLVTRPAPTGSSKLGLLCPPTDLYGRYTIRATLRWGVDESSITSSSRLDDSSFSMRKPYTRTGLSVSTSRPAYGQRVVCRVRVWDERPGGYVATPFAWVHLEKRVDGRWVRVKGSRTLTHSTGRVRVLLPYLRHHHRPVRIRAVAETAPRFQRSASPVVQLW